MLGGMSRVLGLVGDAIVTKTGWFFEIRGGGISKDGKPQFYM